MNKLNLLAPEEVSGYLNGRGRELVKYLTVPNIGRKELKDDIKKGALFFKAIEEIADKRPSKTVVIRTDNRENGLMALSYLAAIYNEHDRVPGPDCVCDLDEEAGEDYFEIGLDEDEDGEDAGRPCEEFEESPWRIPLINASDIRQYLGDPDFDVFGSGGFGMQGQNNVRNREPWWSTCRKEPVCILNEGQGYVTQDIYNEFSRRVGNYFKGNRHIFVLEMASNIRIGTLDGIFIDDEGEEEEETFENPSFTRMVLETAAEVIDIKGEWDKDKVKSYRMTQFENWLEKESFKLEEGFNEAKIVGRIMNMKNESKSALIHQIVHYIREQVNSGEILTEKNFDILKRFANIIDRAEHRETSARQMEKQLYGMEEVKKRVREVVDVMKYNKRRESLGFKKGGFHNVHLFVGAPGTAKTQTAQFMGNMMMEQNLLPGNRFTCVNGADLKGMYVGHTAPKVKRLFEENDIIMIDEAYSLTPKDDYSRNGDLFSQEAIATLITEIEAHGTEKLVIFAGYGGVNVEKKDNLMKRFIDSNPGLKSRINSTIFFSSYSPEEMVEIVHRQAKYQEYSLSRKADKLILEYFKDRAESRDFGNGREARSLLQNAAIFAAIRTKDLKATKANKRRLQEITVSDIRNAIERQRNANAVQRGRLSTLGFNNRQS
ncbi:MAG: AAA family ATPase [Lachnospiraceae bacterium]|nr:AAA family ATPase [Lachnospiraceae bacterium]